ncbi:hypothetical protein HELRODRAFT_97320 [Helobdella robusta]|uniref:C2 domain-containing protein n=1 Tax=Helobdella robusta TaxID=6412 RepID=T1G9G4_HELRO|nr:hypothetical protein HELRODRAFT_97320 [Helobdella robusta]ESO10061.1 hypothetical protein HELRODRAFT_97320 [Helobdella robusta]
MVTDDYMGEAIIEPNSLNVDQETEMNLMLTDGKKNKKFKYMGYLLLQCKLTFGIRNLFDNKLLSNARSNSSSSVARSFFLGDHQRKKKKKQKIKGSVNIVLVEGRQLIAMDDNGFSDPYVKFQLGNEKFKSKCKLKTLNPKWVETFDIDWLESDQSYLDINVYDHDVGGKDDVLGRAKLDLTSYEPNRTHNLKVDLEDGGGYLILLLTICPFDRNDDEVDSVQQQQKLTLKFSSSNEQSIYRSFQDISDVGHLVLTIHQARGLAAADIGGKSDPFCVVELVNTRLQTHTDFKTLNPKWGKEFYIQVTDIHSVLEITVLDYDKNKKSEFLGKVAIPLLRIENDRRKWYALKDKKLQQPSKGSIEIQGTLYYNHVKAVYRTMHPREDKIILPDATFKLTTMKTNIDRVFKLVEGFVSFTNFINSCFNWDNPLRSLLAFIVFMLIVWNIELYMVPISLLLILLKNFLFLQFSGEYFKEQIPQVMKKEAESSNKDDKKSQSLRERLQNIQDVCLQVQETMDAVASLGERIQNAFLWKVPWLSTLGIICLCVATCVFYCLSLRVLLMIWGVMRFSRRWRVGQKVPNNELLDFLSRLPSNKELLEQREILNKFSTSATTNDYDFPVTSANTAATT